MSECMSFPETTDEFIDQYAFKDHEELYTNGAYLIPVFRVRQMLDYYFDNDNKKGCTDV